MSLQTIRILLPDVTAISDEVDGQLTQSMDGYMELVKAGQMGECAPMGIESL